MTVRTGIMLSAYPLSILWFLMFSSGQFSLGLQIQNADRTNYEKISSPKNSSENSSLVRTTPPKYLNRNIPTHNFWPWVPVEGEHTNTTYNHSEKLLNSGKRVPSHNFWPWIPMKDSEISDDSVCLEVISFSP